MKLLTKLIPIFSGLALTGITLNIEFGTWNCFAQTTCNVALNKPATASGTWTGGGGWVKTPTEFFSAGNTNSWNSGGYAPAWIQVDLQGQFSIDSILLDVSQLPNGNTVHEIYTSPDMNTWTKMDTISRYTSSGDILTRKYKPTLQKVRGVKINTTKSPSWIGWNYIKVYSTVSGSSVTAPTVTASDTTFCKGDSTILAVDSVFSSYLWSNGKTTQKIAVKTSGTYSVTVPNSTCGTVTSKPVTTIAYPLPAAFITGTDTLCSGRTSTLTANGGKSYLWKNTGDTTATITITPLKDTTYFVTVTDSNNCNKDTSVAIKVNSSPKDTIVGITNICKGDSTILTASGGTGYSWSTNDTTSAITIIPSVTTTYSVAVTNGLCTDTAVAIVQVTEVPVAAIFGDTSLCKGNSSTLKANGVPSARDYLWNTGDTTATININPLSDMSYWVIAFNGICSDTTQKNIKVNALPAVKAEQDTTIIQGSSVLLSASGTNIINYLWTPSAGLNNDAIFNPTAKPMVTTIYVVTGTDANKCSNKDSVTIAVKDKEGCKEFFIPNAFSPNGNGFNDSLYVRGCVKEIKVASFAIYDRWGEKVFETADITKGWDGTYNGKALNTGVFVYYVKATLTTDDVIEQKGNISLIR